MPAKQLLFVTMWGVVSESGGRYPLAKLPQILDKLKSLGYDGIEMPVALAMKYGSKAFQDLLTSKGMKWIAMVFSCGPAPTPHNQGASSDFGISHPADSADTRDVARHQAVWSAQIEEALHLRSVLQSITSHTGKDYWGEGEADDMFRHCVAVEEAQASPVGVQINHETHRGRILYSPWVMPRILAAHPKLHLCADLSHFSCVAESGPEEPEINKVVQALAPRVRHVHARVGFEEGPQIPDPRAPAWQPYLLGYEKWWAAIYRSAAERGLTEITTTPEFGPAAYAWTHAYTGEAINNVWACNHHVGQRATALFAETVGKEGAGALAEDPQEGVWPEII